MTGLIILQHLPSRPRCDPAQSSPVQPSPDYESYNSAGLACWLAGLVPAEQRIYRLGLVVLLSLVPSSHATISTSRKLAQISSLLVIYLIFSSPNESQ